MDPHISIIVPVFKAEKTLSLCIDSILAQTYTKFELLLIDDGSPDNSGQICDEYAEKENRIMVIHKKNGGASSARNAGLDMAKGEWITFCDADDWVYPRWLDNYMSQLTDDCDIVVQGFEASVPFKGKTQLGFNYMGCIPEGLQLLHENNIKGYIWCKLFKRSIIEQASIRFDERFNLWEDEEFVMKYLSHCHRMNSTDSIGYYYCVPDWGGKYTQKKDFFRLLLSLYQNSYQISAHSETNVGYLNLLTNYLLYSFKVKSKERKKLLHIYRTQIGKNLLRANLLAPTKWAIYLDYTECFSAIVLKLHVSLKSVETLKKAAMCQ